MLWSFTLPRLQDARERSVLKETLRENKVKVVIIDPLYLCLLDGASNVSASNLYEVGPLLLHTTRACLAAGATPVLVHHATQNGSRQAAGTAKPLELDDLMFSGIGEFARQWLLVSRTQPYQPGSGEHKLLLAVGGSAGQSGCWQLNVRKGVLGNGSRRTWRVDVPDVDRAAEPQATDRSRKARSSPSYADYDDVGTTI